MAETLKGVVATDEGLAVWEPCTHGGLLDALWDMNVEIGRLDQQLKEKRAERDNVQAILLRWSIANADDAEEPWRLGGLIEGKRKARARWHLDQDRRGWSPRLDFEREEHHDD